MSAAVLAKLEELTNSVQELREELVSYKAASSKEMEKLQTLTQHGNVKSDLMYSLLESKNTRAAKKDTANASTGKPVYNTNANYITGRYQSESEAGEGDVMTKLREIKREWEGAEVDVIVFVRNSYAAEIGKFDNDAAKWGAEAGFIKKTLTSDETKSFNDQRKAWNDSVKAELAGPPPANEEAPPPAKKGKTPPKPTK